MEVGNVTSWLLCRWGVLQRHGLVAVVDRTRLTSSLDRSDLLFATAGPRRGETLRDEEVAGVPVLDLDNVAGATQPDDLVRENQLCHLDTPYRPAPA
jgi:hypothetical protein